MPQTPPSTKAQRPLNESVYTTAPVEPPQGTPVTQPTWIRLPKTGQLCPYTGLSRSAMNALILGKNPPVKSVSLKKRCAVRGVRLIHLGSLLDYIEGMAAAQQPADSTENVDWADQETNPAPSETGV